MGIFGDGYIDVVETLTYDDDTQTHIVEWSKEEEEDDW